MTEFAFEKIVTTKSGLPGQSKKNAFALSVTVDGKPLTVQHWDNMDLRTEMHKAANNDGYTIISFASAIKEAPKQGPFLTATPA